MRKQIIKLVCLLYESAYIHSVKGDTEAADRDAEHAAMLLGCTGDQRRG